MAEPGAGLGRSRGRAPQRRSVHAAVAAVVAWCAWAALLPGLAPVAPAGAQVPPDPRPMPAPVEVSITDTGYEPAAVSAAEGQSVVFTNRSATEQAVTDPEGLFDSGPIPPGGAFTISLGAPGLHSFATTA